MAVGLLNFLNWLWREERCKLIFCTANEGKRRKEILHKCANLHLNQITRIWKHKRFVTHCFTRSNSKLQFCYISKGERAVEIHAVPTSISYIKSQAMQLFKKNNT
jgi:hypothetical protein